MQTLVRFRRQFKVLQYTEANENDLNRMLDLYNYYLENTTVAFDHSGISLEEFLTRVYIKHNKYKTFLIMEKEFYGFCFITQFRKKIAYTKTAEIGIYLKPQFTGRGFGPEIVRHLETTAKRQQIEVIIASISSENTASLALFRRLGYTQCAHYEKVAEKFGRKLDLIHFQKIL